MTQNSLKQKRKQLMEELQNLNFAMLRGSLVKKYRRCGKPNCHCAEEQGHEGYALSVSMPGRSPLMVYVSLKNKEMVMQALANYQNVQRIMEEISNINREMLAQKEPL
jgi:hypothetical protein